MEKWQKFNIGDDIYIIKFRRNDKSDPESSVTCWLSNFKTLWSEAITSASMLQKRFSESNHRLDIENDKLLDIITHLPESIEYTKFQATESNHKLSFEYHLSEEIRLRHWWLLRKSDDDTFFEHITKPMMAQLLEMHNNRASLIDLVQRKDQEIEQYKLDGAPPLTRKQLVTRPFDIGDFMLNAEVFQCSVMAKEFGSLEKGIYGAMADSDGKDREYAGKTSGDTSSTSSNNSKSLKGFTPLKRIQPIQYDDSDEDSQKIGQSSDVALVHSNQTHYDGARIKRTRKVPDF